MKKIFTLVFSVGLLTSAFAQTDRRNQSAQNNGNRYQQTQSPVYNQRNDHVGYSKANSNGGYNDHAFGRNDDHRTTQWNQPIQKQYGFDRDREMRDHDSRNREQMERQRMQYGRERRDDFRNNDRSYRRGW